MFGVMWGAGLALHTLLKRSVALPAHPVVSVAGWLFTMVFYLVSLAIFRAPSLAAAGVMLEAMAGQGVGSGTQTVRGTLFVAGIAIALIATWLVSRYDRWPRLRMPAGVLRPIAFGAAASIAIVFASVAAPAGTEVFFYFQF